LFGRRELYRVPQFEWAQPEIESASIYHCMIHLTILVHLWKLADSITSRTDPANKWGGERGAIARN
jgi:hypothetical protein